MFKTIWTSTALSENDMNRLQQSLSEQEPTTDIAGESGYSTIINCQIISAIILGLQTFFDNRKIQLLIYAAGSADEEVKIRAYIGLLITLDRYKHRINYYPDIKYRIDSLSENESFNKIVYLIILRFILSKETEKITAKMQKEIVPEMLKLFPKANKKSANKDKKPDVSLEFFEFEMNPEWIEKFEQSSLGKKMEEFNKWQEEGADVMLFSFVHLKHFPFFQEISNWFLPFHPGISIVKDNPAIAKSLQLLTQAGVMCNSDLHSFFHSIMMLQNEGRQLPPLDKLESQLLDLKQQKNAELQTRDDTTERIIGHYIIPVGKQHLIHVIFIKQGYCLKLTQ
jgi:hypothetical protein